MARRELELHILKVGDISYGVEQPVGDYTDIGNIVGVKKAPAEAQVEVHSTVSELQKRAKAVRLSCRLRDGKINTILCAVDKVASALGTLRGKTLAGSTIKSVTIPRKRSRR
jgi:hypothetical protein